ncbi:hypothetical protein SFOMI_0240 [Sphingobium fuliginis]|uniref:Uncharacterized protein n=1 Tax=Sphingobium fuliginis (strain ATCC 27551) TaxID=336203 RepID=A0A292ZA82_SPHSA|nr:hypothetical protein SFOMI_0240 [Sphingobium fuliginis]
MAILYLAKLLSAIIGVADRATRLAKPVGVVIYKVILAAGSVKFVAVGFQVGITVHVVHVVDHPLNQSVKFWA